MPARSTPPLLLLMQSPSLLPFLHFSQLQAPAKISQLAFANSVSGVFVRVELRNLAVQYISKLRQETPLTAQTEKGKESSCCWICAALLLATLFLSKQPRHGSREAGEKFCSSRSCLCPALAAVCRRLPSCHTAAAGPPSAD